MVVLPRLLKWAFRGFVVSQMTKAQQDFQQKQQKSYTTTGKKEGQIDVDFVPPKNGKNSNDFDGGEYIDYEEVK
jgi:hypothetical protein